jgi:N6-adenosine-specific RNA methylase IME4
MAELVRYEAACRALYEAKSVDEVKTIRDKAAALKAYARQAKNRQLEIDAAEIRMRAERRVGELMEMQRQSVGLATGGKPYQDTGLQQNPVRTPTLEEAGIDKNLADRARKMAAVPEEKFEAALGEWRERVADETMRVTSNLLLAGERAQAERVAPVKTEGKYSVIVIDPPWQMEKIERTERPNQSWFDYPTMDEAALAQFDVNGMSDNDCHLFCWTTQKFLPMALRLVEVWGFKYVLTMVWHKPGGFQPFNLPQYNCEFAIYARKGSPKFVETKAFNTCFAAPRREHSRKPDEFYDLIRRVTDGTRIDVFSREARDGFEQYGNEVKKFEAVK